MKILTLELHINYLNKLGKLINKNYFIFYSYFLDL